MNSVKDPRPDRAGNDALLGDNGWIQRLDEVERCDVSVMLTNSDGVYMSWETGGLSLGGALVRKIVWLLGEGQDPDWVYGMTPDWLFGESGHDVLVGSYYTDLFVDEYGRTSLFLMYNYPMNEPLQASMKDYSADLSIEALNRDEPAEIWTAGFAQGTLHAVNTLLDAQAQDWDVGLEEEVSNEDGPFRILVFRSGNAVIVLVMNPEQPGQIDVSVEVNGEIRHFTGSAEDAMLFIESALGEELNPEVAGNIFSSLDQTAAGMPA